MVYVLEHAVHARCHLLHLVRVVVACECVSHHFFVAEREDIENRLLFDFRPLSHDFVGDVLVLLCSRGDYIGELVAVVVRGECVGAERYAPIEFFSHKKPLPCCAGKICHKPTRAIF